MQPPTSSESITIGNYLINHGDTIKLDLQARYTGLGAEYPSDLEQEVVVEVVRLLTKELSLSYIEVAEIVDYEYLVAILGEGFFDL